MKPLIILALLMGMLGCSVSASEIQHPKFIQIIPFHDVGFIGLDSNGDIWITIPKDNGCFPLPCFMYGDIKWQKLNSQFKGIK